MEPDQNPSVFADRSLPVSLLSELDTDSSRCRWLVDSLWLRDCVGILGGPPKCRKSWLGLELAVSVTSGSPCLGRFAVEETGPALVFMAEDPLIDVKKRVEGICRRRGLDLSSMPFHIITVPQLRLDKLEDRYGLVATIEKIKPRFLLLDPLVRLHSMDENSSRDISALLGFLRVLQREFELSILVTHHANKKTGGRPGERLRGSSDIFAFADSLLFLYHKQGYYELSAEHRSAAAMEPLSVDLDTRDEGTCLQIIGAARPDTVASDDLPDKLLETLHAAPEPMTRTALRDALRVNNHHLGNCLAELEKLGQVVKTAKGWTSVPSLHLA